MVEKLSVQQTIAGLNGLTLGDFWSWAYSDVLNNRNRSILAEFLVASALGVIDRPRVEWDAVDLCYRGKGIEVKSAAYLQSWKQEHLSAIRYDIAKKLGWDAESDVAKNAKKKISSSILNVKRLCVILCVFASSRFESSVFQTSQH